MSTPITPTANIQATSSYNFFAPLMAALRSSADKLPKTSLPEEIPGSVQSQAHLLPPVTIYTQHGQIAKAPLGNLLGHG